MEGAALFLQYSFELLGDQILKLLILSVLGFITICHLC